MVECGVAERVLKGTAQTYIIATDNGLVWRVRVGPEADRAAAERLRDSIAAKLGLRETIIVSHP